jgi:protein TonB
VIYWLDSCQRRRKSKEMNYLLLLSQQLKATFAFLVLAVLLTSCSQHSPNPKAKTKQQIAKSEVLETKKDKEEKALPEAKQTPKEKIIPPAILPCPEPDPYPDPYPFPEPPGPVLPGGPCPKYEETPYDPFQVDVQPEYPGGMKALMNYIDSNLVYPADALENQIVGRVFVRFTVLKNGSTTDFKMLRGLTPSIDREVIRVLKGMKKWQPGMLKNEAVDVYFTIPVKLTLD